MFSKLVLKCLRKTVDDGHKWGCLPYKWDPANSSFVIVVHGSWKRKFLWYFNIAFYTIYMVYLGGRYLQRQLDESSLVKQITTEYIIFVYVLPLVVRWCIFLRYEELADFLNSSIKLFRKLDSSPQRRQEKNLGSKEVKLTMKVAACRIMEQERRNNAFNGGSNSVHTAVELEGRQEQDFGVRWPTEKDSLFTFIVTIAIIIRWLDILTAFIHPERDHLLTTLLPDPAASPLWQRALLVIPHVYIWWTTWAVLNFAVIYGLAYVRATVITINFAKNLSKTSGSHETPWASFRRIYRSLQLLQGKQNDAFGLMVSAHKMIMTVQTVRSLVLVLSNLQEEGLLVVPSVLGLSSWFYLHRAFQLFGSVHEESKECLREWKETQRAPRWFRRTFIQSCWPLKIHVGEMYYADKEMSSTLNTEILNKIIEAVLASK